MRSAFFALLSAQCINILAAAYLTSTLLCGEAYVSKGRANSSHNPWSEISWSEVIVQNAKCIVLYWIQMKLNFELYEGAENRVVPTVVMHGWANSLETVKEFAQQLANYSPIFAVDLPGHGQSPIPEQVWGMQEFADELKRFLDERSLTRVNLVGHSFGGKTAIKFISLYSEYVERLVLIGASGLRAKPTFKRQMRNVFLRWLRQFIRYKNTAIGKRIYQNWYIPRFASRDYLNAGPMTATFVKTVNEELGKELSGIAIPSLLIWGELDEESPVSVAKRMAHLIRDSTLIVIPGQGHHPFNGSSRSLVVKYVRDFLWGS